MRKVLTCAALACSMVPALRAGDGSQWSVLPICGGGYVQNVCVAPSATNVWYTYVDVGGPYRSDDAGRHWRPLHQNFSVDDRAKFADHVRTLDVDPRDADSIVLVSGNWFYDPAGVYVSRDGGKTFRQTLRARFYGNGFRRMYGLSLARNPRNPDELVCGEDFDGLYRSVDNGETWTPVGGDGCWFTDIRYDRTVPGRVYACAPPICCGNPEKDARRLERLGGEKRRETGFWRSDDSGATWRRMSEDSPHEICQMPGDRRILCTWCESPRQVCASEDGGETWQPFSQGLEPYAPDKISNNLNYSEFYAFGAGPDFWLVGDAVGGIYRRGRNDAVWTKVPREVQRLTPKCRHLKRPASQLRMESLATIVVDPRNPAHWLTTDWFAIWETSDAGRTWDARIDGMMQLVSFTMAFDRTSPDRILYGVADMGYFTSADGGKTYFSPEKRRPYAGCFAQSARTPGFFVAVGGKVATPIMVTHDGGDTWNWAPSHGAPNLKAREFGVYGVGIDPLTDDIYIAVSGPCGPKQGGVYRSTDCGTNWVHFSKGLVPGRKYFRESEFDNGGFVSQIVFSMDGSCVLSSHKTGETFWLDRKAGEWRKSDARGWSCFADPFTPGRFIRGGKPMLESTDGGRTFRPNHYMPSTWALAFDAHEKGLVAFALRDGIYISRDGGLHACPLPGGFACPTGSSRHIYLDRKRLFLLTSGSGVYTLTLDD